MFVLVLVHAVAAWAKVVTFAAYVINGRINCLLLVNVVATDSPFDGVVKVVGVPGSESDEPPPQAKSVIVITLSNASKPKYFL